MNDAKENKPSVCMLHVPGDGFGPPSTYMLAEPSDRSNVLVICVRVECPPGQVRVLPLGELQEPKGPNPYLLFYKPLGFSGLKWITRLLVKYRPELEALTQAAEDIERDNLYKLYKYLGD